MTNPSLGEPARQSAWRRFLQRFEMLAEAMEGDPKVSVEYRLRLIEDRMAVLESRIDTDGASRPDE